MWEPIGGLDAPSKLQPPDGANSGDSLANIAPSSVLIWSYTSNIGIGGGRVRGGMLKNLAVVGVIICKQHSLTFISL